MFWVLGLLIGRGLLLPTSHVDHASAAARSSEPAALEDQLSESRAEEYAPPGRQDLYGKEVSDALAEYEINGRGALYELHSPNTAVPKPGAPAM